MKTASVKISRSKLLRKILVAIKQKTGYHRRKQKETIRERKGKKRTNGDIEGSKNMISIKCVKNKMVKCRGQQHNTSETACDGGRTE